MSQRGRGRNTQQKIKSCVAPLNPVPSTSSCLPCKPPRHGTFIENVKPDFNLVPTKTKTLRDTSCITDALIGVTGNHRMDVEDELSILSTVPQTRFGCPYEPEIFSHLLATETTPDPPNWTADISLNMRMVLIDWLIEVTEEYHLQDQTLLLAIIFLDKCLYRKVTKSKDLLQLLGISCLFVAAKIEEVLPPPLKEFSYITDHTYSTEQILQQEKVILSVLEYKLHYPTVLDFLPNSLHSLGLNRKVEKSFALYLMYLALPSSVFFNYLPSELATAIALVTKQSFNPSAAVDSLYAWEPTTNSSKERLRSCTLDIFTFGTSPPKLLTAAKDKFNKVEFGTKCCIRQYLPLEHAALVVLECPSTIVLL